MQSLIETSISLVLVFLLVSLIVTAISEAISRILRLRGKTLWTGLKTIIDNETLRERFYGNGLVFHGEAREAAHWVKDHPSYIAPATFARALTLAAGLTEKNGAPEVSMAGITKTVTDLDDGRIRDVMVSALAEAQEDVQRFEASLAKWYQSAMDRLSGDYKRMNQSLSLFLGLGLAVLLNIDALALAERVQTDPDLRATMVAEAMKIAASDETPDPCGIAGKEPGEGDAAVSEIDCLVTSLDPLIVQLGQVSIGWSAWSLGDEGLTVNGDPVGGILFWVAKLVGWLITGFAVTLGAPFWFDLLKRFVNIRSTGTKPEENPASAAGTS